jgi:hypothetical protein
LLVDLQLLGRVVVISVAKMKTKAKTQRAQRQDS